jgi:serine/threonine protein kinase
VGAVGYFLLTGTPVFSGEGLIELCRKHIQEPPEPPSQRLGKPVSPAFEQLLLECLAKKREDRPASTAVLLEALETLRPEPPWTRQDAKLWWSNFNSDSIDVTTNSASTSGIEIIPTVIAGQGTGDGAVEVNM